MIFQKKKKKKRKEKKRKEKEKNLFYTCIANYSTKQIMWACIEIFSVSSEKKKKNCISIDFAVVNSALNFLNQNWYKFVLYETKSLIMFFLQNHLLNLKIRPFKMRLLILNSKKTLA